MKIITSISPDGITYLDDEDTEQFIDFENCHQNNLRSVEKRLSSRHTEEEKAFWQKAKYVGVRLTFRDPPAIEFYTVPRIYFEFPTSEDVWKLVSRIKEAGWRTNDGE